MPRRRKSLGEVKENAYVNFLQQTLASLIRDASVDAFIDEIEAYNDCANTSDIDALKGMSMLLTHEAATWWAGLRATVAPHTVSIGSCSHANKGMRIRTDRSLEHERFLLNYH
ncbi:Activity-regulated cytoskeleton associated protein 2 [Eumeta japonica]|uniref:Activity-regulated cytoskeleton associated protein 2 n=1 Tax=Eumeta variegata TaxID=151549 RepID=A0A4C1V7N9_EUMVA|nr:Activity-regulated cytoskeleton associated protein 2 [Eumeta japonica]